MKFNKYTLVIVLTFTFCNCSHKQNTNLNVNNKETSENTYQDLTDDEKEIRIILFKDGLKNFSHKQLFIYIDSFTEEFAKIIKLYKGYPIFLNENQYKLVEFDSNEHFVKDKTGSHPACIIGILELKINKNKAFAEYEVLFGNWAVNRFNVRLEKRDKWTITGKEQIMFPFDYHY